LVFSSPFHQVTSGTQFFRLYIAVKNWLSAYEAAFTTACLIPLLTPRSSLNSDKQNLLLHFVGLAPDAAAIALTAGKSPYEAIRDCLALRDFSWP